MLSSSGFFLPCYTRKRIQVTLLKSVGSERYKAIELGKLPSFNRKRNPSDCAFALTHSLSLSVPPCCWFHGKEVNLFILDNYLSGNPLKQFAIALFCGERNNLSGVYLTRQRDKKATREWAIRPPPSRSNFLWSSRSLIECFWWECGFWQESGWRNINVLYFIHLRSSITNGFHSWLRIVFTRKRLL